MDDQTEPDEKILTFDIPDEALERAASAERQAFTLAYCTNGHYGSLAMLAAILRASSLLSSLAAERRPGSTS
jgi:hypothetical protein